MSNIKDFVLRAGLLVIFVFLMLLSAFSACSTVYEGMDLRETHYFVSDSFLANIFTVLVLVILLLVIKKVFSKYIELIDANNKLHCLIKSVLLFIIFSLGIMFVLNTIFDPYADALNIQQAVVELRNGDVSSFVSGGYIELFLNQVGFLLFSYILSFIFNNNYLAIQIINVICVVTVYGVLEDIGREYFGLSNSAGLLVVLLGIIFYPFIMYSSFVYGNVIGLCLFAISVKYCLKYLSDRGGVLACLSSVLCAVFAVQIKQNYLIGLIAILVTVVFANTKAIDKIKYIVILLTILIAVQNANLLFLRSKTGQKLDQGFPSSSWVAMGLQESWRGPGWYNGYNYDVYYNNGCNKELADIESKNEIGNRAEEFLKDRGYGMRFFVQKISSQWNEPSFESFGINQIMLKNTKDKNDYVMRYLTVDCYNKTQNIENVLMIIVYFGALLYVLKLLVSNERITIARVVFLIMFAGGFIFHIFWEAKAQYTITYFVLLFPCAISGFTGVPDFKIESKKWLALSLTAAVLFAIIWFVMKNKWIIQSLYCDGEAYWELVRTLLTKGESIFW